MLTVYWSAGEHGEEEKGSAELATGGRLVCARRMDLPARRTVVVERLNGSVHVWVRLPYVSDPALVVQSTAGHPVVHRGQRANGAIVEITDPFGTASALSPGQSVSVTAPGSALTLRFPAFAFTARLDFEPPAPPDHGTGTVQLGVDALDGDDAWLVAALAVALSPAHGVVGHAELKAAFARWRGEDAVRSDGAFDRNVLRPALASRGIDLPGPRLNKIVYLVERCRRTREFPERVLQDIRRRLAGTD